MNKISFLLMSLTITMTALSQAYEGTIQYGKKKQPAIAIDYSYPAQAVENAIIRRMEKLGYRVKEEKGLLNRDKGFLIFKNTYITDISKEKLDYIIKVERKSRKENDEAILYLIMQKDGTNTFDKMTAEEISSTKDYLNKMLPDIEAANLDLQIKAQEDVVAKAEKKLKDLKIDQASLEAKLQQNKTDQDNTQKDIEAQKQSLGVLFGKRKTN